MAAAPRLVPQRFSTETCILEVIAQSSTLSRWSARPVVKRLRFRLWLNTEAAPLLLAQGNLAQLEALNQRIQQTIQARLVLPRLRITENGSFSLEPGPLPGTAPQPIIGGQLRSLSHLQLCDIAAAVNQCEQHLAALPQLAATVSPSRRQPLGLWLGSAASLLLAVGVAAALWPRSPQLVSTEETAKESVAPIETAEVPSATESVPFTLGSAEEADTARPSPAASPVQPPSAARSQSAPAPIPNSTNPTPSQPTPPAVATPLPSATAEQSDLVSPDVTTAVAETESDMSNRLRLLETTREVEQYFQAQWQANQADGTLVYRLQLNPDGSIASFEAVNAAAAAYRDRISLPNVENPAFSAVPQSQPQSLRVELQANGQVQVSAE